MSEDVVEIIENLPDIIEISDDEDGDIIVINCNDLVDLADDITMKEESTTVEPFEVYIKSLHAAEAQTTEKHANPVRRKVRRKKRRKLRRRKAKTTSNGVQRSNSPNGFHDIETEPLNHIFKQEKDRETSIGETENTNNDSSDFQSDCFSHNSNTSETTTTFRSSTILPAESPPSHREIQDYSKLKWLKPLNSLASPPHLQLVIIDRSHPEWKIDDYKWLMIEKRLLETLHSEMLRSNDKSIGLFDGAKWQRGIKVVGCNNQKALNFIKKFILKLDKLWAGAKLDAFTLANFARQICKVFIPPPILKTDVVLSLIKLQNPSICSEDWEVLGERERNNGIDIWISISEESLAHLQRSRGEIKYGINRIFVNPVL